MTRRGLGALSFSLLVFAACTGGSDSGTTVSGPSSSSGNASTSSGSTSSGGSSSGGNTSSCTEFAIGGTNDPGIGGAPESQTIAQSAADYAGAALKQIVDLTVACKAIATKLDAPAGDQAAADGKADARAKADAWCKLAVVAIGTSKATAGGTLTVQFQPPACKLSVQEKAACQGRCMGSACDVDANPMVCTGGTLAGGYCTGGELEGGCKVEAKCDASCEASVVAKADCPAPAVSVSTSGAGSQTEAEKLKDALEAALPKLLSLKAQCALEAKIAGTLSGNVSAVTDIKPACIVAVVKATGSAAQDVQVCAQSAASVAATIN